MDALLGLIIALIIFALLIFLAHRSYKKIIVLGAIIIAFMILSSLGAWL